MSRLFFSLIFSLLALYSAGQSNFSKQIEELENTAVHNLVAGVCTADSTYHFHTQEQAMDQPMRIASISKPITAVAAYTLVEAGLLRLDEHICDILPNCGKHWEDIQVKHLLAHSAGIGGYKNNRERENTTHYDSLAAALRIFKDRKLRFDPGTDFEYTSYGYTVLGRVMELKTGQPFPEILQERVFVPAGMKNTTLFDSNKEEVATTYHRDKKGPEAVEATNLSDRLPGGGVLSTVADLLRFSEALMQGQLLSEASTQALWKNYGLKTDGSGYGHGFYLYGDNPNLGPVVGHTGAQTGCSAFLFLAPKAKKAVVVISDTSGAMQEISNLAVTLLNTKF